VPVFEGFKQAAEGMGCEAVFSGTPDYDITKQIASFEQDLVKNPAGILLHPMQADPFIDPINRAIDSGRVGHDLRGGFAELEANGLCHLGQSRRGEVRGGGDRQEVGDSAEYAVLENPGPVEPRPAGDALIAYMERTTRT
jgi:ribose transport system substrate-binding protein